MEPETKQKAIILGVVTAVAGGMFLAGRDTPSNYVAPAANYAAPAVKNAAPARKANCFSNIYNCDDFSTCSEVMEVFDACSYDVHELDRDEDGIPCESLCN
jgi:hypothetical protein